MKGVRTALDVLGPEEATPEISVKLEGWTPAGGVGWRFGLDGPNTMRLAFELWSDSDALIALLAAHKRARGE